MQRREFIGGLAAAGAAALLPGCQSVSGTVKGRPYRIDIHHHLIPPGYADQIAGRRIGAKPPAWSPAISVEEMDRNGIATSITSLIQPGVWFGDVAAGRRLAREANEFAARMARDFPGRFGVFAALPLPDTEGSLREIEYALDALKADGIGLLTSYGDKWLGDASFAPVMRELDRRRAVVYTHPHAPQCCRNLVRDVAASTIEFATDTTRTIASLLFSGSAARYPEIRWIFSHGGGTMPFLLSRFTREEETLKERAQRLPRGVLHELRKFHYDTAQANHRGALAALLEIVPGSQILFGTDYPFRSGAEVVAGLAAHGFGAAELRAIDRGNALRLLPKLRAA